MKTPRWRNPWRSELAGRSGRYCGTGRSPLVSLGTTSLRVLSMAKCVVVLWTTSAKNSEWVRIEAAEGADRGILAPALVEETKIPLRFRRIQAANLVGWSPRHA